MQNSFIKFAFVAMVLSVFTFTACVEDETPTDPTGPSISFVSEAGYLDGDAELQAGETFSVKVTLEQGDEALKTLTLWAGADQLAVTDFVIAGQTSNNPFLIIGAGTSVTYDITITAKEEIGSVTTYAFEVGDDASRTAEVSLAITIVAPPTTPINAEYTAVVLNNADGPDYGSLDLETGLAVSSSGADGDIQDKGIDLGQPIASNWYQQIYPKNGAAMRIPDAGQVENFSFENADTREMLAAAWDTGADASETPVLAVGDLFMILIDEDYYLVEVGEIVVDPAANTDYYELNIKGSRKE